MSVIKGCFTDIRLELGNTYVLNATLYPSSEQLGEVVVTADAKANIGASENFSTGRIQETPTVDRNIYDVVKNMPMAMTSKTEGSRLPAPITVITVSRSTVR